MATVRLGSIVSDIRGSVGEQTFGRNRGGIFVRDRVSPAQPESSDRDACQATVTALSQAWSGTLSEDQRKSWRTYAVQFPRSDQFGRPKNAPPHTEFIRSNFQYYRQHTATLTLVAPATPPPGIPAHELSAEARYDLTVAGDLDPDVTGEFAYAGEYNARQYSKLNGQEWYHWWYPPYSVWFITDDLGGQVGARWAKSGAIAGSYNPMGGATGNAIVSTTDLEGMLTIALPTITLDPPPTDLRLYAYAGDQVAAGRNYYYTPWRYVQENHWDGDAWTTDPWSFRSPWTMSAGKKIWTRLVAVLPDGAASRAAFASTPIV